MTPALQPAPATDWAERVEPDEAERHQQFSDQIQALQKAMNRKYGPGRAFHRPQIAGLQGELVVTTEQPELRQGVFSHGGRLAVRIRMSQGGVAPHPDLVPDIHGFAFSIRDIEGPGALADTTDRQDFLMINRPAFGFPSSAEFAELVGPASRGQFALAKHMVSSKGPVAGPIELARVAKDMMRPFSGFATASFFTAAAIAYGPYAARLRLVPVGAGRNLLAITDFRGDIAERLRKGDLTYDLQVQFFVAEETTPIENLKDAWPEDVSPFHSVATLTIPRQEVDSEAGEALSAEIERDAFDPWNALAEHRPLGEVMRARKVAYFPSVASRRQ